MNNANHQHEPVAEAPAGAPKEVRAVTPSAVVLRADQDEFDQRQISALALMNPGLSNAPRAQLAVFFHYCVRSGLDPFARQIYMIGRKNRGEDWEENPLKYTIQTGIDGFRTIAHRAAERTGERISYEDTVYYDTDGNRYEVWLSPSPPAAVKVTVLRGESRFPMIARWGEFAPTYWDAKTNQYVPTKMWRTMPAHMLRKCAEAGSLRMAAPQDLSGVYADEEMAQAEAEVVAGRADDATRRLRAAAGMETGDKPTDSADSDKTEPDAAPAEQEAAKPKPARKRTAKKTTPRKTTRATPST